MSTADPGGPDGFLAMLRSQPGAWNAAKADAFERLWAAFPDPAGPPEWGLRQILRGQFDRRLPPAWKPAFVEVFHQWLGWRAEAEHVRSEAPGSLRWWARSLLPALRSHGWASAASSPLAMLLLVVVSAWAWLGWGASVRSLAGRRAEAALERAWSVQEHLDRTENDIMERLRDGSTEQLAAIAGLHETANRQREHVREEVARMEAAVRTEAARARRSWWRPW